LEALTQTVREMARCVGAAATGVVTTETLEGGPPSADLTYVRENAKSALCFAVPLDESLIEPYLRKEDHRSHEKDNVRASVIASGISLEIASFLNQKGYPSVPQPSNLAYRTDTKNGPLDEIPPIAHRYLAVRSGVGHFGFSGNVITKEHGAAVILGSVVTEAELVPTDPLPPEDNYCDECRLCCAACASSLMSQNETTTITLGGAEFSYSKRRHHNRCDYVCGGFTGLHPSGKWSTWSPGRFPIPEEDRDFRDAIIRALPPYLRRPGREGGFFTILMPGYRIEFTCGHCQLLCHPDAEVRKERYRMLIESGVTVQNPDGSREAVSPEEAEKRLAAMSPETRALYGTVSETMDE
jgi:epoxyqueuosine reductase